MWIYLNDAFLSIVAHREQPGALLVRARIAGDLERVFPGHAAAVEETPSADYRYRLTLPRADVAQAIGERALAIDYDNFKNSIPAADPGRHDAYFVAWHAMQNLQARLVAALPRRRGKG